MYLTRSSCVICGEHINKIQYNLKTTLAEKSNVLLIKLIEKLYKNVLFLHCNICTACYDVLNELDAIQQRQKELFSKLKENISRIEKTNVDKSLPSDNEDYFDYTDMANCDSPSPSKSTVTGVQLKKDDPFEEEIKVDCIDLKKLPITIKRVKAEINESNTIDGETSAKIISDAVTKKEADENNKLFEKIQSSIKRELSNHMIEQANKEKPSKDILCEICGMAFRQQVSYLKHIKKHDDAEDEVRLLALNKQNDEWHCNVCCKAFQQKAALKRHLPIHTGVARYQCEHCGKDFIHQSSFRMHLKIHANRRDEICEICKHAFLTRSHLKRHLRTAHQPAVKQYACNICQKKFVEQYNLNAHLKCHQPKNQNENVTAVVQDPNPLENDHLAYDPNPMGNDRDPLGSDSLSLDEPMVNENVVENTTDAVAVTNEALVDGGDLTIYNVQNALGNDEGLLRIHEPTTGMTYTIKCSNLF